MRSNLTCLRQVESGMNNVCEVVITTITPNGSATLPFVIPSQAEDLLFNLSDPTNLPSRKVVGMSAKTTESGGSPCCSFCHMSQDDAAYLTASPTDDPRAYICGECVEVCHSILGESRSSPKAGHSPSRAPASRLSHHQVPEVWRGVPTGSPARNRRALRELGHGDRPRTTGYPANPRFS